MKNPKEQPKQNLINLMKGDEELGLYDYEWCKGNVILPKEEPFTEIQQKSLESSKALVKSLSPEELDSLMAEFDDMESEQETLEEAIGLEAHEYSMQYIGTDKYTVSMLAIEFGYQLAQQENKNLYSEEEVLNLFKQYQNSFSLHRNIQVLDKEFQEWFAQFKRK